MSGTEGMPSKDHLSPYYGPLPRENLLGGIRFLSGYFMMMMGTEATRPFSTRGEACVSVHTNVCVSMYMRER